MTWGKYMDENQTVTQFSFDCAQHLCIREFSIRYKRPPGSLYPGTCAENTAGLYGNRKSVYNFYITILLAIQVLNCIAQELALLRGRESWTVTWEAGTEVFIMACAVMGAILR